MRHLKRIISLLLTIVLCLSLCIPSFGAETEAFSDSGSTEEEAAATAEVPEETSSFSEIWTEDYLTYLSELREQILNEGTATASSRRTLRAKTMAAAVSSSGSISSVNTQRYAGTKASSFGITTGGSTYTGFCMAHNKYTPAVNSSVSISQEDNELVRKLLYYGWGGPAQWSGFNGEAHGVVLTALALSWAYSGKSTVSGTNAYATGDVTAFYNYAAAQPDPGDTSISFSASSLTATKDVSSSVQITSSVRLNCGNSQNYVQISIDNAYITLVNDSTGKSYSYGQTATVCAGEYFHLEAPLSYDGSWSFTVTGALQKATAYKAEQSLYQDGGFLLLTAAAETASLSATFSSETPQYASVPVSGEVQISLRVYKKDSSGQALSGAVFTVNDGTTTYTSTPTNASGYTTITLTYPTTSVQGWYVLNPESLSEEEIRELSSVFVYTSYEDALAQAQRDWRQFRSKRMGSVNLTITEIVAPSGYELADPITTTVDLSSATVSSGSTNLVASVSQTATVSDLVEPNVVPLETSYQQIVTLEKKDSTTGQLLQGATFQVENADEESDNPYYGTETHSVQTMTTQANGIAKSSAFTYTLAYRWFYCTNWSSLTTAQQEKLQEQYADSDNCSFYTSYAEAVAARDTQANALIAKESHNYTITEVTAPTGYFTEEPITITVAGAFNGFTALVTIEDTPIFGTVSLSEDFTQTIHVKKVNADTQEPLANAVFQLTFEDGAVQAVRTGEDGLANFSMDYTVSTQKYTYITDWERLTDAQKRKYSGYYRSEEEARAAAQEELDELLASATHSYTITEVETPNGYFTADPVTVTATGQADSSAGQTMADYAVQGVEFTYLKVASIDTYSALGADGQGEIQVIYGFDSKADAELLSALKLSAAELPLGLYLVVETAVPENITSTVDPFFVSLPMTTNDGDEWIYDVTVYPKNQSGNPTLTKSVTEVTSAKALDYQPTATASDGDTVAYHIASTLPTISSKATYLTEYSFVDTLSKGITYNKDDVVLEFFSDADCTNLIGTWKLTDSTVLFSVTYSSGDNGAETMTVAMTAAGLAELNPKYSDCTLRISYSCTVNSDAETVYGDSGNPNDVVLTWRRSNTTYYDTLKDDCTVYTYGLDVTKQFSGDCTDYSAVTFNLYNDSDGYFVTAQGQDGVYYVTGLTEDEASATTFTPGSSGKLLVYGLEDDRYLITELTTANGYTLLKDKVEVVISSALSQDRESRSASATVNGDTVSMEEVASSANALAPLEIVNTKGFNLPQTGGGGSLLLTVGGMLLAAAGGFCSYLLLRKHRK